MDRPAHARAVEVDSLEQFDALVAQGARSMRGWRLQDVDLTGRGRALRQLDPAGAVLLGVSLTPADEASLRDRGALLFPRVPDVPFSPYRASLYTAEELYAGLDRGYAETPDARIWAWARGGAHDVAATLATALHDHAVDDALADTCAGSRIVGVMGGHAVRRGEPEYADAVRLGRELASAGLVVATGGGPGAMEGANLGARTRRLPQAEVDRLVAELALVPGFAPSVEAWAGPGLSALRRLADEGLDDTTTLGVPTWFYGHEPPNVFARRIAKYFRNALREDTLLRLSTAGLVFLPGKAGTVQEIFQDACENYYAAPGERTPLILVGRDYWTRTLPAWPLLHTLLPDLAHLVDSVDDAAALLLASP